MKKVLSIILTLVLVLSMSITAFAATTIEGESGSGSVDITYTYEAPAASYIVTIPDSMTIGTDADVSISNVTVTAGYLLTVSVSSEQYSEGWKLVNGDDALGYTLKIDDADIENNATVLTAKNSDAYVTKTLVTAISDTVTPKYSGSYTDTLTFSVSVAECEHNYADGTCTICGVECAHNYEDVTCTICGFRPTVDGTLGGKTAAAEEDIWALVEQLKAYVDSGSTVITVTGETPAMINMGTYTTTAIGEAINHLSSEASYNGKIDLILSDVTEIVDYEFQSAYALNSITLPKVTKLGYAAFIECRYLKKITFGSVVTEGTPDAVDFYNVGTEVGGCDLVLHRGQVIAEAEYQPDGNTMIWWNTTWNSITLM